LGVTVADETPELEGGQTEENVGYKPKPPLWQPKPEKPMSTTGLVGGGALILLAVFGAVLLDGRFLSIPVGQTEATIIRLESGRPPDETPAAFRYLVQLPDGSRHAFTCGRIHRPGERLMVTSFRGRLTGRIRLGSPYRVMAQPSGR
jgi:hypothetical protein